VTHQSDWIITEQNTCLPINGRRSYLTFRTSSMKLLAPLLLLLSGADAFAPLQGNGVTNVRLSGVKAANALPPQWTDFQDTFSSFSLADAMEAASDVADAVPADDNGWFGFLTGPIESFLELIHTAAVATGLQANAWGISIIILTVLIKVATFPLTKSQMESTSKMQAMSPAIKEIQAKYQSNPEVMNQKIAEFYQVNEINPLAGCIPSLVQIPVFIGLYRAVLSLAKDNKLDEPFLFLPNLEGPTYGADPAHGSDWLFQGWTDAGPSLGWDDTISFLILPVLLVISQFLSMELMQPKTDDPAQQQSNVILKILPIMIGWFSLNVPAALCVYWLVNNFVTTGTSLFLRSQTKFEPVSASASASSAATIEPPTTIFAPPREKPAGFGGGGEASIPRDAVKPITAIDAEVVDAAVDAIQEGGEEEDDPPVQTESQPKPKKKKGKRGRKRKN